MHDKPRDNWIQRRLKESGCQAVRLYPMFAEIAGGINAGLMLSQLTYWYTRAGKRRLHIKKNGERVEAKKNSVHKKADEWKAEIGLSPKQVRNANGKLKKLMADGEPVVEINPAPPYWTIYTLYPERLFKLVESIIAMTKGQDYNRDETECQKDEPDMPKDEPDCPKVTASSSKGRSYNNNHSNNSNNYNNSVAVDFPLCLKELFNDETILNDVFSACGNDPARAVDLCQRAKGNKSGWILRAIEGGYAFPKETSGVVDVCSFDGCGKAKYKGNSQGVLCQEHYTDYRQIKEKSGDEYGIENYLQREELRLTG